MTAKVAEVTTVEGFGAAGRAVGAANSHTLRQTIANLQGKLSSDDMATIAGPPLSPSVVGAH